ncbi:unnamed protein product [Protopolystoma xenopodis]|uniref:Uncharacterized protein n=1 Tax=Protopolystoma xenopodis TaxID=117903 RepID=A0A448X6L3_9PLAT|nr:unnamed protein product [Protopolystoma xenopodis]
MYRRLITPCQIPVLSSTVPTLGLNLATCEFTECDKKADCFWRPFKQKGVDGHPYECVCRNFWMSPHWRTDIKPGTICISKQTLFLLCPTCYYALVCQYPFVRLHLCMHLERHGCVSTSSEA